MIKSLAVVLILTAFAGCGDSNDVAEVPQDLVERPAESELVEVPSVVGQTSDYAAGYLSVIGLALVIAGGGDSAADWAVELAPLAKHVHVIHRRAEFRAAEETVNQLHSLAENGNVTIHTPCQLNAISGQNKKLETVTIADLDGNEKTLEASKLLCFFGISPSLGPIVNWGLDMNKKTVNVEPSTMATNIEGVAAVGDIAEYGHKLHLILTGFAESALAIKTLQTYMDPDKKFKVVYSTSKGVPQA
ncbi:MAG: Ferredoxin--NADP reductase 2 [Proteobacteria bacterium]|nr:MAG: Ferredoxin--NADP reductase 2 [Pseudomonadota bacterium]